MLVRKWDDVRCVVIGFGFAAWLGIFLIPLIGALLMAGLKDSGLDEVDFWA